MRYCADTWFFIELSKNERRALEIIRALGKHKNRIIIPAVVLLELRRISIRSGKKELSNDFIKSLELNKNFEIINCDLEVSIKAGEISANYNIPAIDSIIVASAIIHKCHRLISKDNHCQPARQHHRLKTVACSGCLAPFGYRAITKRISFVLFC